MTVEFFDSIAGAGYRREKIGSIFIRSESDLTRVRDRVRLAARELGFDNVTQIKLTTAASELTRNIYEYARTGSITVSVIEKDGRGGMEIVYEDNGPGIPELERILAGDFHSRTGLGKGIAGSRRLMDVFGVESLPGKGTRIETVKWFDDEQRMQRSVDDIRNLFFSASESSMVEELQAQNKELVRVLSELTQSRRELEQANRELQEANDKLKQVDEMKSRFISTIAHEVRTPLNAITGLVSLLSRNKAEPLSPAQRETVERLEKSITMLIQLVNDLLDLSRLQARRMQIKVQAFDAAELIDSIYAGLKQTAADKGVSFNYEVERGLPPIASDPTKVTQVITNLASNAIKFTPPGGSVSIKAGCAGGDLWHVEVSDTGMGIAEDQIPPIFEEFRQVNISNPNHGGGTGLGLPISKRLVELLGGRIKVVSAAGAGSSFTVLWPLDVRGFVDASLITEQ
ncbi:MAG TPA: ATP-binding protein [Blastocatellia bacterium]|nr:ATP-binding protein [Blastocatellia bacterium]